MSNEAQVDNYFHTPIWVFNKSEWLDKINKVCDKYIKAAYKRDEKHKDDFGWSYHSNSSEFLEEPKLKELHDWVGATANNFLDFMGYDLSNHTLYYTESWVQEFSRKGGGGHNSHIHGNNHVSAFYYLKCTERTSRPIFHDPRKSALMMRLPEKDSEQVTLANDKINYIPKPGTLIMIPAYLEHEYGIDDGKEDFRFIHFNLQAIDNKIIREK
jgi:uncharacterized protein (TIGR02466 family)